MKSIKANEVSELWQTLCQELYSNVNEHFLSGFREPHNPANRFSTWQPKESTFRYHLTLVFNEVRKKNDAFFDNYKKLGNTILGQPLCVSANGVQVNLDYLTSLEEYNFLSHNINLNTIKSVVEIGGGFGRTAHTLLKLCPNIERYTIIDLPAILKLSSGYLERVLETEFSKINFVSADAIHEWEQLEADLAINIDSFQEMPQNTIKNYIDRLFAKCNIVYIKNPVCKYSPKLLGIETSKNYDVFTLGLMTEVANIFDEVELNKMRIIYANRYLPSAKHIVVSSLPSELFAYYQHILYQTN
jgi:putative sugar O-methyltransferase